MQDQDFFAKCLSEASLDWTTAKNRQMVKTLESSMKTVEYMEGAANQLQAQI